MSWTPPQHRLMADISDYQPTVDARAYAHAGRRIIMIKAGEGTGNAGAARYPERADAAHDNRLAVVHYLMAICTDSPQECVRAFCGRIKPHWHKGDRMLIDVEAYSGPPQRAASWLRDAQIELRTGQHAPLALAYTNEAYLAAGGTDLALQANWWLIAAYDGHLLGRHGTPIPPAGRQLLGKQYTDGAVGAQPHTAPGIGPCDNTILTCAGAQHLNPSLRPRPHQLPRRHLPHRRKCNS